MAMRADLLEEVLETLTQDELRLASSADHRVMLWRIIRDKWPMAGHQGAKTILDALVALNGS